MDHEQAAEWLSTAERARRRASDASRRAWFPLVVFGLITLGSAPFYREAVQPVAGIGYTDISGAFVGGFSVSNPRLLSLYWMLATVAGYLATIAYFRWRDARSGVRTSVWPFVVAGLALFALVLMASPNGLEFLGVPTRWSPWFRLADAGDHLYSTGLAPVLTIAVGLVVLAIVERSRSLIAFAAAFLGLALVVSLDDLGSFADRLGLGHLGAQMNVILAGAALLLGGIAFAVLGRRRA
jgi:hypothetical protein